MSLELVQYVAADESGEIRSWGICQRDHLVGLEGYGHPDTHYVRDGEVVAYTAEQAAAKAAAHDPFAKWDNVAMAWVDPRSTDDVKQSRWAQMKLERDRAEYGGFTWDGSQFDSDAASQSRIHGAVLLAKIAADAGESFEVTWTLSDNSTRTLNAAQVLGVGAALGEHVRLQHDKGRAVREALEAAATVVEVEGVAWP